MMLVGVETRSKRQREQARNYGVGEPRGKSGGEEGVGSTKRRRVGLEAAMGKGAPGGEGGIVYLMNSW